MFSFNWNRYDYKEYFSKSLRHFSLTKSDEYEPCGDFRKLRENYENKLREVEEHKEQTVQCGGTRDGRTKSTS